MDGSRFSTVSGQTFAAELLFDTIQTDCTFEDIPGVIGSFEAPTDLLETGSEPFYVPSLAQWVRKKNVRSDGSFNLEFNWGYTPQLVVYGDWSDALTDIPVQVPPAKTPPAVRSIYPVEDNAYPLRIHLDQTDYLDFSGGSHDLRISILSVNTKFTSGVDVPKQLFLRCEGLPTSNFELLNGGGPRAYSTQAVAKLSNGKFYERGGQNYGLVVSQSFLGVLTFRLFDRVGVEVTSCESLAVEFAMDRLNAKIIGHNNTDAAARRRLRRGPQAGSL